MDAAEAAHVMFQAVTEFVTGGCGSLTDVRFVIYQSEMVDTFTEAARHAKGLGLGKSCRIIHDLSSFARFQTSCGSY